jgi:uncharacterized repeat protein (TIGR01451 family)
VLGAEFTVALVLDADRDGVPTPGDTLRYTATVYNPRLTLANDVVFGVLPDPNLHRARSR